MYEREENSRSSSDNSACDENDYDIVPSNEVFCNEEEKSDDNYSIFLDYSINVNVYCKCFGSAIL